TPATPTTPAKIEVPTAYTFDSRFEDGKSSVSYSGQVVRQLLIQDLKIFIGNLGKDGATPASLQDLLNFYDHDDALSLQTLTTAGLPIVETTYASISSGKNLLGKISADVVLGSGGKTADDLIREWFDIVVANSQDPAKLGTAAVYTTDAGLDLSQMINKLLIGAVSYAQATSKYFAVLLDQDNTVARNGTSTYTAMEHYWDESFGYFGAARDYARYSDEQLAGKSADDFTFDSNGDGQIDLKSEYNFGLSRNAGKRDKGGSGVDFTKEIFDAYLAGRTAITNQGTVAEISVHRQIAAEGMEKVIAATAVHYINDTLGDMSKIGTADENAANHNKHWAEMKAFTMALQYNTFGKLTAADLEQLHTLMGDAPKYDAPGTAAYDATVANLTEAASIFESVLGFSSANVAGW
ncbi:MAG TPA: hypothetical protein DHW45_15170, partial [Candidatus Latescibacteria bacterium]|nr:hypothetical protein [Candidatus Latescibacterota bacterium]